MRTTLALLGIGALGLSALANSASAQVGIGIEIGPPAYEYYDYDRPRTRVYRNGVLEAEGFPIAQVSDHLADDTATVWFDLCRPTAEELSVCTRYLSKVGKRQEALEDVFWGLVNSTEFQTRR